MQAPPTPTSSLARQTPICTPSSSPLAPTADAHPPQRPADETRAPVYGYQVVNVFPHDRAAYTQGLAFDSDTLYEATGRYGESSLREVELETGRVVRSISLSGDLFGEGIAICGSRIVQLTWRENLGLVYDRATFDLLEQFSYPSEGWGLTYGGRLLIMSDGTSTLRFLDPLTFQIVETLQVVDSGVPVSSLNELEYVDGEVYANVYLTELIAIIDPASGQVTGWIDLSGLGAAADDPTLDVLNGIAYDATHDRLFVTGKLWPVLFEIDLVEPTLVPPGRKDPR